MAEIGHHLKQFLRHTMKSTDSVSGPNGTQKLDGGGRDIGGFFIIEKPSRPKTFLPELGQDLLQQEWVRIDNHEVINMTPCETDPFSKPCKHGVE